MIEAVGVALFCGAVGVFLVLVLLRMRWRARLEATALERAYRIEERLEGALAAERRRAQRVMNYGRSAALARGR